MSASAPAVLRPDRPRQTRTALPPELGTLLGRAGRRLRVDRALFGAVVGLGCGLGTGLLVVLAMRIRPMMLPDEAAVWCLGGAACGLAIGALAGLVWPAPRLLVAIRTDLVLGLRERISTALELAASATPAELAPDQIRDAVETAGTVGRVPRLGPAPGRRLLFAVGTLALLVALGLGLPNPQSETIRERRADAAQVEAARDEVETVAAQVAARTDLDPAVQEAMLARLAALTDALEPGEIGGADAQAEIAAAEGDLRRLEDGAAPSQAQALREAAPRLQTSGATAEVGNALAAGDLAAAAEAMEALGERVDDLSPEEQQALANRLNELAAQVQATNPELAAALAAAAASLAGGDPAAAAASLSQAGAEIGQVGTALAANDAANRSASSLASIRSDLTAGDGSGRSSTGDTGQAGQSGAGAAGSGTPNSGQSGSSGSSGSQSATPGAGLVGDGQSGAGQAGSQGQSAGSGSLSGSGQVAGSNARTTDGGTASGNAQPQQGEVGTEGSREEESVYAPAAVSGQPGSEEFLPGQEGQGNSETGAQTGAGVATGASVPYTAVYSEYAQQASRDLEQGSVPAPLQPYVRDYFSALDPGSADAEDETP